MPIDLDRFSRLRPFLYHLTSATNVSRILRTRRIESAARLMHLARRTELIGVRRREHISIAVGGEEITIRDQAPLHQGNMALADGWSFTDFVSLLNSRVFFWPGKIAGPISYGVRHYERYVHEKPVILRVPTKSLLIANPKTPPHFCRYNSGSPRCSNGLKSPRDRRTFVTGDEATFGAGHVVEVTFSEGVMLPEAVEAGSAPAGPWIKRSCA